MDLPHLRHFVVRKFGQKLSPSARLGPYKKHIRGIWVSVVVVVVVIVVCVSVRVSVRVVICEIIITIFCVILCVV